LRRRAGEQPLLPPRHIICCQLIPMILMQRFGHHDFGFGAQFKAWMPATRADSDASVLVREHGPCRPWFLRYAEGAAGVVQW
jgi:hypothetical protein